MTDREVEVWIGNGPRAFVDCEDWVQDVLPRCIRDAWNNAPELESIIRVSLDDEFFQEIEGAAERLVALQPNSVIAWQMLSGCKWKLGKLDDSERAIDQLEAAHGESGYSATHRATIASARGDVTTARRYLHHALKLDPNAEKAMQWVLAIASEEKGEQVALEVLKELAKDKRAWRARCDLAAKSAQEGRIPEAIALYREAIAIDPTQSDLLVSISGELGKAGRCREAIELVEPHYRVGTQSHYVGTNLVNCYIQADRLDAARNLIDQLEAQKFRPLDAWIRETRKQIRANSPGFLKRLFSGSGE